jgi:putative transposon-encoded protein
MTAFTLSLDYDYPTALLEPDGDGQPRQINLVIDWRDAVISAETRAHDDNTQSEYRWRGMEDAYPLPPLVDATRLREWVEEEVLPRALPLLEAYQTVWEDVDQFGRFPGHENEKQDFDAWMAMDAEPPTHEGGLWSVADWLSGGVEEVSHETTDAAIEALADRIVDEAASENVVLVGGREAVRAYLLDYRQDLRDAIPEPDRYEIEGYEVVVKVAKPSGTTARVWVPKSWEGKRVKIVRIEP